MVIYNLFFVQKINFYFIFWTKNKFLFWNSSLTNQFLIQKKLKLFRIWKDLDFRFSLRIKNFSLSSRNNNINCNDIFIIINFEICFISDYKITPGWCVSLIKDKLKLFKKTDEEEELLKENIRGNLEQNLMKKKKD